MNLMRTLTRVVIKWPWLTILVILGITAFFAVQLRDVRIDNEIKDFLPEDEPNRQQYFRSLEVFGGEFVAIIGISVEDGGPNDDIFNPAALAAVQELNDWLEGIEITALFEHMVWVEPEDVDTLLAQRGSNKGCTPEQLKYVEDAEIPEDVSGYDRYWVCKDQNTSALKEIVSLATMKVMHDVEVPSAEPDGPPDHKLMIEDLWEDVPKTQAEADQVREWVKTWQMYENNVVSAPDPKTGKVKSTAIYAFIPEGITIGFTDQLQKMIDEKIAELDKPGDGLVFRVGGVPMISVWLGRYMQSDLRRLIPVVFAVILFVLIVSFRTSTGVVMPFATVVCGTIWTVGLTVLVDKPLTLITSAIPTLITAVGSAYTIHIIHHFLEQRRAGVPKREAVVESMDKVGLAVVMAGLTTVGGFFSLTTSTVLPIKDFGLFASFGALACLVISITLVPALLMVFARDKVAKARGAAAPDHDPAKSLLGRFLLGLAHFVSFRRKTVAIISLVVGALVLGLASQVIVSSDLVEYFKDDSEISSVDNYLKENFGGTNVFYVAFDGREADYWKEPERLAKLDELIAHVEKKFPGLVGKAMSPNDYVKKMWMALSYDDPASYRLPPTRQGVADTLFMYSQKSDTMESVIDFDYRRVRVSFKIGDGETRLMGKIKDEIDDWVVTQWPEMAGHAAPKPALGQCALEVMGLVQKAPRVLDARYQYSGEMYLRHIVDRLIVVGQMRSVLLSLLVVFVLAAIIFRSVVGGMLAVVPAALAVLGNFGLMGLAGYRLDVGTALVAAAAVGIGVDYAIHYINRYRQARIDGAGRAKAVELTHLTSGKAIVFNAVAVALGFFVLIFSNFNPVMRMGLLTGMTMLSASLISLTILPVLLIWLRPRFIRQHAKTETEK